MIGLTLSGGGAKGAYHVGALEALMEVGLRVDMVSGASIGALNGALISSAPGLWAAVQSLGALWRDFGETSPVEFDFWGFGCRMIRSWKGPLPSLLMDDLKLCSDAPLLKLMRKHLDSTALQRGKPLYVSLYEAGGLPILRAALAEQGVWDTPASTFLHLQSLPACERMDALLASAAIPGLYAPREVRGVRYSDGGQGGWSKSQGNTPVEPLIEAGCRLIFVIRLSDSPWESPCAPETTFVDLHPLRPIRRKGGLMNMSDVLDFSPEALKSWRRQGYADTRGLLKQPRHEKILRDFGVI